MKPHPDYHKETDWMNNFHTVGVMPTVRAHNKKPVAKIQPKYLREVCELSEYFGHDRLFVWEFDGPSNDTRSLAFTPGLEDKQSILLCGCKSDVFIGGKE